MPEASGIILVLRNDRKAVDL